MGLATAIAAPENEPAQRILGVVARDIVGLAHAWQNLERFECLVTERIEIRDGAQVEAVALFDLRSLHWQRIACPNAGSPIGTSSRT